MRTLLGWPLVIAAAFWLCASITVTSSDEQLPFYNEQKLTRPIFSRVEFKRINEAKTEEQVKNAEQAVPNYFHVNQAVVDRIQAEFRDVHAAVKAAENFEKYQASQSQHWALDQAAFDSLKAQTDETGSEQFKRNVDEAAKRLTRADMIERADIDRAVRSTASKVEIIREDGKIVSVPKERLQYATNPDHVEQLAGEAVRYLFTPEIEPVLTAIIRNTINPSEDSVQPLYQFDRTYTRAKIDEVISSLEPVMDEYVPGDLLVKPSVLEGSSLALLRAEHEEYLRKRQSDPTLLGQWRWKRLGLFGVVFLVVFGLSLYTARCQPRVLQKPARTLALAALLLGMLVLDRMILVGTYTSPIWSVATVTMTAAVLTVAYSQAFAIGATSVLAILTILTLGASFSLILVLLTVASVTVLLLREIRTRLKMVVAGSITAVAAGISAGFVSLSEQQGAFQAAWIAALAAFAGIGIVMILLPVIEKVFRITTSQTLLEWADTSNPLLRQLIENAPGTWQHSHLLGSMAEAAAEEIRANGLLVRVGAYYHDIGKICKPTYFVENQQAKMNAHQGLAPTMSLLVILAHVKDGIALARENRLPKVLTQFIVEHHGTTVVRYFHALAAQEAKAGGRNNREVSDTEFRYPGPKPLSRETAILMVCDGAEGAVRALQDPTPSRIENVVHDMVMARLMDGQFDDCDITLKELARVEQSLVKSLCAIHHGRIAYPKSEAQTSQVRTA